MPVGVYAEYTEVAGLSNALVTRNRVVLAYVGRALRAERRVMDAKAHRRLKDAEVYRKVAMYLWMQAEYGQPTEADMVDGQLDPRVLDRSFLAVVTLDTEAVFETEWGTYHTSILIGALDALPVKQVETVLLAFVGGLTHREIAERLSMSVGEVERKLSHARSIWGDMFKERGDTTTPVDLTSYQDRKIKRAAELDRERQRTRERVESRTIENARQDSVVLAAFGDGAYRTGALTKRVADATVSVSATLNRLAKRGLVTPTRTESDDKRSVSVTWSRAQEPVNDQLSA